MVFFFCYYHKDIYKTHAQILELHGTTQGAHKISLFKWMNKCITIVKLQTILYGLNGFALCIITPIMTFFLWWKAIIVCIENTIYFIRLLANASIRNSFFPLMGIFGSFVLDFVFMVTAYNGAAYITLVILDLDNIKMEIGKAKTSGDFGEN